MRALDGPSAEGRGGRLVLASDLDDLSYCHLKFALRCTLGDVDTPASLAGTEVHDDLQQGLSELPGVSEFEGTVESAVGTWREGHAVLMSEPLLVSEKLNLAGRPDLVLLAPEGATVIEFKTGRGPGGVSSIYGVRVWDSSGSQMVAYGLLMDGLYGITPELRIIYEAGRLREEQEQLRELEQVSMDDLKAVLARGVSVPFTEKTRGAVKSQIDLIQSYWAGKQKLARSHQSPARCRSCVYCDECEESISC